MGAYIRTTEMGFQREKSQFSNCRFRQRIAVLDLCLYVRDFCTVIFTPHILPPTCISSNPRLPLSSTLIQPYDLNSPNSSITTLISPNSSQLTTPPNLKMLPFPNAMLNDSNLSPDIHSKTPFYPHPLSPPKSPHHHHLLLPSLLRRRPRKHRHTLRTIQPPTNSPLIMLPPHPRLRIHKLALPKRIRAPRRLCSQHFPARLWSRSTRIRSEVLGEWISACSH